MKLFLCVPCISKDIFAFQLFISRGTAKYKRLSIKMYEIIPFEIIKPYSRVKIQNANNLQNLLQAVPVEQEAVLSQLLGLMARGTQCSSRREENLWPIQSETSRGKEACEDGCCPGSIKSVGCPQHYWRKTPSSCSQMCQQCRKPKLAFRCTDLSQVASVMLFASHY